MKMRALICVVMLAISAMPAVGQTPAFEKARRDDDRAKNRRRDQEDFFAVFFFISLTDSRISFFNVGT